MQKHHYIIIEQAFGNSIVRVPSGGTGIVRQPIFPQAGSGGVVAVSNPVNFRADLSKTYAMVNNDTKPYWYASEPYFYVSLTASCTSVEEVSTLREQIQKIKDAFGLSKTSLAAVLGVSRHTLISWIKDEGIEIPNAVADRIAVISIYAFHWSKKNPYPYPPSGLMQITLPVGKSLLELLQQDPCSPDEIKTAFAQLAQIMVHQQKILDGISANTGTDELSDEEMRQLCTGLRPTVRW